jgi:hypothetical protein
LFFAEYEQDARLNHQGVAVIAAPPVVDWPGVIAKAGVVCLADRAAAYLLALLKEFAIFDLHLTSPLLGPACTLGLLF